MHYLLFYHTSPDYLKRRSEFRTKHLQLAWDAYERGELIHGGALKDPDAGAVLLFQGDSPEIAESFAKNDPYVKNGLVEKWEVQEWITVVGDEASTPIRP
ncbi:MAG: YciI-like protein [Gracilimonas sp.]